MSYRAVRPVSIATVALIFAAWSVAVRAQDLEPRAYSNSPTGTNFLILGYGYTTGHVLTDPSLPIENVTNEAHVGVLGFARVLNIFGKSAKFDMLVPFAGITAKGLVFGQPHTRQISGLADPYFRFSINFLGAPALTAPEFKKYRQDIVLGASLRIGVPLGQYDDTRLVNVGSNRWSIRRSALRKPSENGPSNSRLPSRFTRITTTFSGAKSASNRRSIPRRLM